MSKKTPVVALCMPVQDKIHPQNFESYRFLQRGGIPWHHISVVGQPIARARNIVTHEALNSPDVTHLLWIDSDMVYGPDSLQRLLSHDLPFVGGLCFDRRHPYKPVIAREFDDSWGYDKGTIGWIFDYPPGKVISVDFTGGAFLLVKREVFERIREREVAASFKENLPALPGLASPAEYRAWQEDRDRRYADALANYSGWWDEHSDWGSEDLSLCWRARQAGYQIHVDTGLKIGHVGEVIVDEAFAQRNRSFEWNQSHPPLTAELERRRDRGAPVASIVVTAYNPRPEFLRAAVLSALAQTVPCEVIVVDDGSRVPSSEFGPVERVLRAAELLDRVNLIVHPTNRGISAALNTGIAAMTTDWFCWLPCDDVFEPNKVELQLAALLATNRKAGYHGYNISLDNRNTVGHVPTILFATREEQNRILSRNCAINGTTVMLHRSILDKVGPFDSELKYAQDWSYWRRVGFVTDWFGMPDKLATRREFGNLTEALRKSGNPRKQEEDEIVMSMEVPK